MNLPSYHGERIITENTSRTTENVLWRKDTSIMASLNELVDTDLHESKSNMLDGIQKSLVKLLHQQPSPIVRR